MADDTDTPTPPDPDEPAPRKRRTGTWPVRAALAATVVGAVAAGAVLVATGAFDRQNDESAPRLTSSGTILSRTTPGTCLTWGEKVNDLAAVDCGEPHKFEVAGEPAQTLGKDAPYPTASVLAAQRDQLCPPVVNQYLGKRLDPLGKFQIGLLTPGEAAWNAGDRTLRCGVQLVDGAGVPQESKGKAVNQDMSVSWPVGTCVSLSEAGRPAGPVDCSKPHAFEVTATVDLRQPFPDASWPTEQQQSDLLQRTCPQRTAAWFGNDDGFRKSGLQLAHNAISQPSWAAGSRTAICYLTFSKDGRGYTPITGSAKSPGLLIDGKPPVMPTFPGAAPTKPRA